MWLTHGTQLIRAAQEHLRASTNHETSLFEIIKGQAAIPGMRLSENELRKVFSKYLDFE